MPIRAEFVLSVTNPAQFPKEGLPEIAFAGRSNVGKSSLINKLLNKSGLAKTSKTPGRTQALNYYRIHPETGKPFFLVDMPGYGFAKINLKMRQQWERLIEHYLQTRETLCGVIHLVDLRHPPQPLDLEMVAWLQHYDLNYLIIGTKADKIAKTKVPEALLQVAEKLNVDSQNTLAFSAETGLGRDALLRWVLDTVAECRKQSG
ncbi:MAG: ribosome biogenesis GTP-binding protein YihA/YsxC [Armatimonadota bacterium]